MKRPVKSKTTRRAKRDLIAELSEGMAALKARQGKRNLRAQAVEYKPSLRAKGAK